MRTIVINRNDWSGRLAQVKIFADGTFQVHDCRFKLERISDPDTLAAEDILGVGYRIRSADGCWSADFSLGTVWEYRGSVVASSMGIERDSKGKDARIIAAAQVLFNTL